MTMSDCRDDDHCRVIQTIAGQPIELSLATTSTSCLFFDAAALLLERVPKHCTLLLWSVYVCLGSCSDHSSCHTSFEMLPSGKN